MLSFEIKYQIFKNCATFSKRNKNMITLLSRMILSGSLNFTLEQMKNIFFRLLLHPIKILFSLVKWQFLAGSIYLVEIIFFYSFNFADDIELCNSAFYGSVKIAPKPGVLKLFWLATQKIVWKISRPSRNLMIL
jgi:hypothetical protein